MAANLGSVMLRVLPYAYACVFISFLTPLPLSVSIICHLSLSAGAGVISASIMGGCSVC
jgi:hypothetical protein